MDSLGFTPPDVDDLIARTRVVALPLVTRFRGVTSREIALIDAPNGWVEFSPFLEYDDVEASTWLRAAIEDGWGADRVPERPDVEVNATVPAVDADDAAAVLARFPGARTAKVKVAEAGQSLDDDVRRVRAVRRVLGDDGAIRIDANGGWSVAEALEALSALRPYQLQYAEQPCTSVDELAELRRRLDGGVLIAADESIRRASDPLRVVEADAADVIVVKAQPLGGITRAIDIVERVGLPAVVSSALESSIGLSLGARLAVALPTTSFACGLGTASLLAADVVRDPLVPVGGRIAANRMEPDPVLIDRHSAAPERRRWWTERITRCARLLPTAHAD